MRHTFENLFVIIWRASIMGLKLYHKNVRQMNTWRFSASRQWVYFLYLPAVIIWFLFRFVETYVYCVGRETNHADNLYSLKKTFIIYNSCNNYVGPSVINYSPLIQRSALSMTIGISQCRSNSLKDKILYKLLNCRLF